MPIFRRKLCGSFGDVGAFGPTIPTEYGGGGLDYISYGLIMQEIERGDSGMRSTASVQGSLVMFPIYAYGSGEQRKQVFAQARQRRVARLLRPHGARPRLEPRRHDHQHQGTWATTTC